MRPRHASDGLNKKKYYDLASTVPASKNLIDYPNPQYPELVDAIAKFRGVPSDQILVGNGSSEFIYSLFAVAPHDNGYYVSLTPPVYGEYKYAAGLHGFSYVPHHPKSQCDVVVFCNPNNPTGQTVDLWLSQSCLWKGSEPHQLIVIDEAYMRQRVGTPDHSLVDQIDRWGSNIVVLGTLSKDLSIPGSRVGYAIFPKESYWKTQIESRLLPWSISSGSEIQALQALERDPDWSHWVGALSTRKATRDLQAAVESLGYETTPSETFFFLIHVKDSTQATILLRERGAILVRDCKDYGLPQCIRVSYQGSRASEALLETLNSFRGDLR